MDFLDVPYPHIKVTLNNLSYYIEFDPITRWRGEDQLGHRWVEALKKNLKNKLVLEKNFCFLGFADSKRDLNFLCQELFREINTIGSKAGNQFISILVVDFKTYLEKIREQVQNIL